MTNPTLKLTLAAALAAVAGCAADAEQAPPDAVTQGPLAEDAAPGGVELGEERTFYSLLVYDVAVPAGGLSSNAELWKRIDEQAVDAPTYDLLYKNGLRVGVAPLREFEHVRSFIDDNDARQVVISDAEDRTATVVMKEGVPGQTVMHFDGDNELIGRRFGLSDNRLYVGYRRTPRDEGSLRVSVTPGIEHRFQELRVTPRGVERAEAGGELAMFDEVNLKVDVPVGSFLLLAPSDGSDHATSLGRAMLRDRRGPDLVERALIVIPQAQVMREVVDPAG